MIEILWDEIRTIHFTGIGGIGVSALARYYKKLEYKIQGSDLTESSVVKDIADEGIFVFIGQEAKNIDKDIDLLIYSSAVPETNPERMEAKKLGIPQYSYNEVLGLLSSQKKTVAISGTNGKTTTTAITALMLEDAGLDILALVGSKVPQWNSNLRFGKGEYFIVEACEHQAHMLTLAPEIIVLTNLAEDHLDFYKDMDDIIAHFQEYIDNLPEGGLLIYNIDDPNIVKLNWQDGKYRTLTFGIDNEKADIGIDKHSVDSGTQDFWLTFYGDRHNRIKLHAPGKFNLYNALAAACVGITLGLDKDQLKSGIEKFTGTWRRFEKFKEENKIVYISDYGHHPDAIMGTIEAARSFYPDRRIFTVFQPHHHNRTKNLFDGFVESLKTSDLSIVSDIYDVKGREEGVDQDVSAEDLVDAINKENPNCFYGGDLEKTVEMIKDLREEGDLVLIMGAGDIDDIREEL